MLKVFNTNNNIQYGVLFYMGHMFLKFYIFYQLCQNIISHDYKTGTVRM
jgi:hypothetical protein